MKKSKDVMKKTKTLVEADGDCRDVHEGLNIPVLVENAAGPDKER